MEDDVAAIGDLASMLVCLATCPDAQPDYFRLTLWQIIEHAETVKARRETVARKVQKVLDRCA